MVQNDLLLDEESAWMWMGELVRNWEAIFGTATLKVWIRRNVCWLFLSRTWLARIKGIIDVALKLLRVQSTANRRFLKRTINRIHVNVVIWHWFINKWNSWLVTVITILIIDILFLWMLRASLILRLIAHVWSPIVSNHHLSRVWALLNHHVVRNILLLVTLRFCHYRSRSLLRCWDLPHCLIWRCWWLAWINLMDRGFLTVALVFRLFYHGHFLLWRLFTVLYDRTRTLNIISNNLDVLNLVFYFKRRNPCNLPIRLFRSLVWEKDTLFLAFFKNDRRFQVSLSVRLWLLFRGVKLLLFKVLLVYRLFSNWINGASLPDGLIHFDVGDVCEIFLKKCIGIVRIFILLQI